MVRKPGLTGPIRNVLMGRNVLKERNTLTARNRTRRRRHRRKRIRSDGNWNRHEKSWPHRSRQNGRDWQKKQSGVCGRRYGFTPTTRYTRSSMKTWVWKQPINPSLWRRREPVSSSVLPDAATVSTRPAGWRNGNGGSWRHGPIWIFRRWQRNTRSLPATHSPAWPRNGN